jgi:2-dehydropantoate 2-reductase
MSKTDNGTILIIGTGSLASLFAARLSAIGAPVTMLGTWPAGLEALEKYGVRLVDADGSQRAYPVKTASDPRDCAGARYALVLVKSSQTERAALQLTECLAADGLTLTLQNGLGNRELLAQVLGEGRVASGITTYGANLLEPGRVRLAGEGTITLTSSPDASSIGRLLEKAGFLVEYTGDASSLIWGKLLVNAAINPLTALLDVPNGELLERPSARSLMGAVVQEAVQVSLALGVNLPYPDPVAMVEEIAQRTAANRSSMLQDVSRGTPTEIDAINGAIVKAGDGAGVPTPINRTLWQLIKAKEQGIRERAREKG